MNSKEENSEDFFLDFIQGFGLCTYAELPIPRQRYLVPYWTEHILSLVLHLVFCGSHPAETELYPR